MNTSVLVLNQNYEPLNVCNVRRAFVLVYNGKAEVLELLAEPLVGVSEFFPRPSVIRLVYMVKRPRPVVRLSRREVFLRDNYTCQYCGYRSRELTLDHVAPRHRGGRHTWENLVSACQRCNHRKGGKTPQEARMTLIQQPRRPAAGYYFWWHRTLVNGGSDGWHKFLPGLEPRGRA